MTTPLAHVKGQTMRALLQYAQRELTPGQYAQLLATLSEEERRGVAHILPTTTYPVALVNRLTIEAAKIADVPLDTFARGAGRFNAAEGVKGVYRFLARFLSPPALLSRAASLWSTMNLAGHMTMKQEGAEGGVLTLADYPEPHHVMCVRISGWMEQLLELAGSKRPMVKHTRCKTQGAGVCEWRVSW